ncbi:hypothetical protein, partial [Anabaena sp. UHCC 0204]|uniref:hypothetical protein n=1 Tax=Anabaena sp. UHCC 0204 TaxID=2590009 RepID=UPI001C2C0AF2
MVRYLLRFAVAWGQFGSGLVDLILTIYTNSFWSKPFLNCSVCSISFCSSCASDFYSPSNNACSSRKVCRG